MNNANKNHANILNSLTLDQAIRIAKKKLKEGSFEDARSVYLDILAKFPKNKKALVGLQAVSNLPLGRTKNIQNPQQEHLNFLVELYGHGQFKKVIEIAHGLLNQFPNSVIMLNILGAAYAGLGDFSEAINSYKKAISIEPNYIDAHYNLAFALREEGKIEDAVSTFKKVISISPKHANAYNNLAVTLQKQGKLGEAVSAFKKAISIRPDYVEAYYNMASALEEQGQLEQAVISYRKSISLKPDYADAYFNMASTFEKQGNLEEALNAYNKTLELNPDYSDAWSNGARALESWNELEQLELWLQNAANACKVLPPTIQFHQAKLLSRNKQFKKAAKVIDEIDITEIADDLKREFLSLEAQCFDALKEFDKAYISFSKMNALAKESSEYMRCEPDNYIQEARTQLSKLNSRPVPNFSNYQTALPGSDPVFLVGFPRSGTTLLDTILRSHSVIEVVEEQPTTNVAQKFIYENFNDDIVNQLLPLRIASGARKAYRDELKKHLKGVNPASVIIDKLPLNLIKTPLIKNLYPEAKFILALRHPMDTIFSCWMQNFKLNPAMAVMVDLGKTVDLYCLGMETFKKSWTDYNLNVHLIKYEDLLENLTQETTALLEFLELEWEPQMKNYQKTAVKRGKINTPSYSQVVQPIYKTAKYRWLKYEEYLNPYLEQVRPWIREFGYMDKENT